MIVMDLNDRERSRFDSHLRMVSESAAKVAEALLASDDTNALMQLVMGLSSQSLDELTQVLVRAAEVKIPDRPPM